MFELTEEGSISSQLFLDNTGHNIIDLLNNVLTGKEDLAQLVRENGVSNVSQGLPGLIVQAYLILVRLFDLDYLEPISTLPKTEIIEDSVIFEDLSPDLPTTVIEAEEKTKSFKCEMCDQSFDSGKDRAHHRRIAHCSVKEFKCRMCEKSYSSLKLLQAHQSREHDNTVHECDICGKTLKNRAQLLRHKKFEHDKKFPCDQCDSKFYSQYLLSEHVRRVHVDGRNFACEVCSQTFKNIEALKVHVSRTHTEREKTVFCDQCDARFFNKSQLTNHLRDVHLDQPVTCDICGQQSGNPSKLKRHIRRVHGQPKELESWQCSLCSKVIMAKNLKQAIKSHMQTHEKEAKYSCDFCDKKFRTLPNYKNHINTHKGILEHRCEPCNKVLKHTHFL